MTQPPGELLVIDKAYEVVLWSCRHIATFPRSHRFTLGERMERRLYDLLELLLKAKYTGQKAGLLRQPGRKPRRGVPPIDPVNPYLSPVGMPSKLSLPQSFG